MNRSLNPNAAIREGVEYFTPESDGNHTYIWPYDTQWHGNIGVIVRGYQVDINPSTVPPYIDAIHIDTAQGEEHPHRIADSAEIQRMARLIEEDFGAEAVGLNALKEYIKQR
jgi:hypothetical protein